MTEKSARPFWIGFIVAAAGVALFYYWQRAQRRMQTPGVVLLDGRPTATDEAVLIPSAVAERLTQNAVPRHRPVPARRQDKLEVIKGIGKVYASRLNAAGILTFSDLANSDPQRLAEIVALQAWQAAAPVDWIAAARDLADGTAT